MLIVAGPRRSHRTRNSAVTAPEMMSSSKLCLLLSKAWSLTNKHFVLCEVTPGQAPQIRKDLNSVKLNGSKKRPPSSPRSSGKSKAAKVTNKAVGPGQ